MTTEIKILKSRIESNLEDILGHAVSVSTIGYGKKKTVVFFDCLTERWMKCTLKHGCLISNIRNDE